jgi:glycosyltransferase involved in cell wall biosynthesis
MFDCLKEIHSVVPKISIVLVNYNDSQYLDERIQSLLNQTYKDFELIIIDNGSTDNSVEVIHRYTEDLRIKTQLYPENISPYERWNDGVDLAQGKYLQIVSADDSCHPTLLEKLVKKLDDNPSIDFVYSQTLDIDDRGNPISRERIIYELDRERWSQDFIDTGESECRYMFFECTIANSGAILMRRSAFINAGKFDVKLRLSADHILYIKLLLNTTNFAFIAEPLNYLRRYPGTMTNATKDDIHLEEKFRVIKFLFDQEIQPLQSFWQIIYDPAVVWWIRIMTSGNLSLDKISRLYRIYKLLRDIHPSVNYLAGKEIVAIVKRKLALFSARHKVETNI